MLHQAQSIAGDFSALCGYLLAAAAAIYAAISLLAALAPRRPVWRARRGTPKVSILKPLCGAEPETYACLRSFCDQDYPDYQVVFAIADPYDPVVPVVRRLQREFPQRDLQLSINPKQHGSSRKISNLINMMPIVRHEHLVLADSDVRVERDYLLRIVAPLLDAGVGIVTCPYRGAPRRGIWSILGAMFINEWFMPSVQVAATAANPKFAFGASIALRRQTLMQIGGFEAIVNHLADDYRLGELSRALGLRTVLSDVEVEVVVAENSLKALVQHELRWLRTIRAVQPTAYAFCFVTFGMPVAVLGTLLCGGAAAAAGLAAVTAAVRLLLHALRRQPLTPAWHILLVPARDLLSVALWGWSFTTRRVKWRDGEYRVSRDGLALLIART
jgi:ceramide glucosyltransferase